MDSLATTQPLEELRVRGPPAKTAYKDGQATKALEGFCKKNGADVASVVVEADAKGVEYVFAVVGGRPLRWRGCSGVVLVVVPVWVVVISQWCMCSCGLRAHSRRATFVYCT